MRRLHFIIALSACFGLGTSVFAGPKDLATAFPDKFGHWAASTPAAKMPPAAGALAQVDTEAGLRDSSGRQYINGAQSVTVKLSQYRDPSGAYEAYTARLTMDTLPSTVGVLSGVTQDRLILLAGDILMEVQSPRDPTTAEL